MKLTFLTENARFRFPGGHCRRADFVTDCGGIRKAAAEAKVAAEAKAKAAAAKKLADQEAAARKKAEEEEAARKKAEALAEATRAEKAGVLCGVCGGEGSPSGRWGGRM